jgi:hypothetical protein
MNPYAIVSSDVAGAETASLRARLMAWHDAMVAHERRLRPGHITDACDDECPHVEARALWTEVSAVPGSRVNELTFLRSRALGDPASSDHLGASAKSVSPAGDTEHRSRGTRRGPFAIDGSVADGDGGDRQRLAIEREIDEVLADSFPASDPPSWTHGVARPDPVVGPKMKQFRISS